MFIMTSPCSLELGKKSVLSFFFFPDLITYLADFYFWMDTANFEKYMKGRFGDWSPNVGPVYSSCFES